MSAWLPIGCSKAMQPRQSDGTAIQAHKLHLASHRTSCTRATANQFRLPIHNAYWLMHTLRGLVPKPSVMPDSTLSAFAYREILAILITRSMKLPP